MASSINQAHRSDLPRPCHWRGGALSRAWANAKAPCQLVGQRAEDADRNLFLLQIFLHDDWIRPGIGVFAQTAHLPRDLTFGLSVLMKNRLFAISPAMIAWQN
jgi:hypothetical protein